MNVRPARLAAWPAMTRLAPAAEGAAPLSFAASRRGRTE
jgi:hypothetical protein